MNMRQIVLIAHDIRSVHNVGSLLRTAEGLGIDMVYLTGYTPYPVKPNDTRLPHIRNKQEQAIAKTALGAEKSQPWTHHESAIEIIQELRIDGYQIIALEQSAKSVTLPSYAPPDKIAIVLGREVEGVDSSVLDACDAIIEIPMYGSKESFNVVQAAAMALYHCRCVAQ